MRTSSLHTTGLVLTAAALLFLNGCGKRENPGATNVWGKTVDGQEVHLYTLSNANGMIAEISDYGGIVVRLTAPDKDGKFADVVLGYNTLVDYVRPGHSPYFGAIVGRIGNRVANGRFTLDGKTYNLATNNTPADMPCSLHGGLKGFDKVVWAGRQFTADGVQCLELKYRSVDGEEGYPGNLDVIVTYRLTADNALRIEYYATTDKATPINLTSHSYFNLKGEGQGDILGHELTIAAARFTPVTKGLIPTGELKPVKGTPFDFIAPHAIGERVGAADEQLQFGGGYDHNWVLDSQDGKLALAATVREPTTGRVMEVLTTEPGVQFYIGNFLPKPEDPADKQNIGKSGKPYLYRNGFCLETQHYPDSINHPDFPSSVLRPGKAFQSVTVYRFSAK